MSPNLKERTPLRTDLKRPRGTQDLLAPESLRLERLRRLAFDTAREYGFDPIETPIFEQSAVFLKVGESTDVVQHERYTFTDVGGVDLTLRPEGTAAIARAYVENGLFNAPQPVRLFYWGPMFRRERPQALRYRQHTQFGAELFGSEEPSADAEIMLLSTAVVAKAGLVDPVIRVNSIGCSLCRPTYRAALVEYYQPLRDEICEDCQRRLTQNPLRLLDCKVDQRAREQAPDIAQYWCDDCRQHFETVVSMVQSTGRAIDRDPYLVRGFDYYTRTVFEVGHPELGTNVALFGGGRYDGLVASLDGPSVPGVGFGIGSERLLSALGERFMAVSSPSYYVAAVPGHHQAAFALVEELRRRGVTCYVDLLSRSLKAQIRDANRRSDRVIIVGGREWDQGLVTLKYLNTGEQEAVSREPDQLARRLNPAPTA